MRIKFPSGPLWRHAGFCMLLAALSLVLAGLVVSVAQIVMFRRGF